MIVRRATGADAGILAAMRGASVRERRGGELASYEAFLATCTAFFARELADSGSFLRSWIALSDGDGDGDVVGGASLAIVPTLPRFGSSAFSGYDGRVRDVFVEPRARRRGVARALMQAVLIQAKADRVDRLSLGATTIGMPLYRSLGFVPKGDEMVFAGD